MDKQKVKAMLRARLPFKVAYTRSNFKLLMKLCAEEGVVWASRVLPQDAIWRGKWYTDCLCVDNWSNRYVIATPLFVALKKQPRLDEPRISYSKTLHGRRR